ncbi:MCE family protein [Mycolicibacterium arenosum]|uniref:MCE family protein n=1 Tax=Mycolicibacterium arenosum TaxID=2952157 RepID=A0ABT1M1C6_9MYCO|nr:MCE family protein [Mycolicibacterium sp. CAU 1645]MCP9272948.1 MCE family protein [Mycolicibacterium sp. CAU 1645]
MTGAHSGVSARRRSRPWLRPAAGLAMVVSIALIAVFAVALFRGDLSSTTSVTVVSPRAGLVMNPDAKVKMRGVQVGRVESIEERSDGTAVLRLAMDPAKLPRIPSNVTVDIGSTTVFGSKFVQLIPPSVPAAERMHAGQVLEAQSVTVEINTVFEQLTSVLSSIEPEKLNQTLGAIAAALHGRGHDFGQAIVDLNGYLAAIEGSLPNLEHDLTAMPAALESFADAAPDLLQAAANSNTLSQTVVDQQTDLDALLVGVIGLGDVGSEVLTATRGPLTDTVRMLAPLTDLTAQYEEALYCGIAGLLPLAISPRLKHPGVEVMTGFLWANEPWHYPDDLPKVGATGGPQCTYMPRVPFMARPPWVVADTGANPWERNGPGIMLNSAGLKEALFGPNPGPPRNSAQIGQPG